MKRFLMVLMLMLACLTLSCTKQMRAKSYGGKMDMQIAAGQKVIIATWKDADLWVLTRPMRGGEVPETLTFSESSSWGVFNGDIIFHETT